jgi:autotransporter-associated beta strand protein
LAPRDDFAARRSRRLLGAAVASLGCLFTFIEKAGATTYFFDPNGGTPANGSGTWDTVTKDWATASSGTLAGDQLVWPNTSASGTDTADGSFNTGGGSMMIAAGTTIYTNQIYIGGSNGTLTAGSGGSVYMDGINPIFTFGNNTIYLAAPISGASGITFNGVADFIKSTCNYTGGTTINTTSLTMVGTPSTGWAQLTGTSSVTIGPNASLVEGDGTAADNTSATDNRINTAASLIFAGDNLNLANTVSGQFSINAGTSAGFSQTFAALSIVSGDANAGTVSGGSSLSFTGAGGAGYLRTPGCGATFEVSGGSINFVNTPTVAGGSAVGPGNILIGAGIGNGSLAIVNGSGYVVAAPSNSIGTFDANGNWGVGTNTILSSNMVVNDVGNTQAIDFVPGTISPVNVGLSSLVSIPTVITSGQIIIAAGGSGSYTRTAIISGGALAGPSSGDLVIDTGVTGTGLSDIIVSSVIENNGGASMLEKIGTGQLTLTAANTFTGATVIGSGTLQLGNGGMTGSLASTTITDNGTLSFDYGVNTNLSSVLGGVLGGAVSGSGGITQMGAGTTFTVSTSQSYTGATAANAGTLALDFSQGTSPVTNIVAPTSELVLGGGELSVIGSASGTNSQSFGSTAFNAGASAINVTAGATGGLLAVSLGTLTRAAGSTVSITQPSGTQSTTNGVLDGSTTNTNGVLTTSSVAYATINGTSWAVAPASANGVITGLPLGSYAANGFGSAANNVDFTASGYSPGSAFTINTLRFNTDAQTLTLTGEGTITTGGILITSNAATSGVAISGAGSLIPGSSAKELAISNFGLLTVGAPIADYNSATGTLTTLTISNYPAAASAGIATLSAVSTYTGPTYLNGGTVNIIADSGLGGANGTLNVTSAGTGTTTVTFSGTAPTGLVVGSALLGSTVKTLGTGTLALNANSDLAVSSGSVGFVTDGSLNLNGATLEAQNSFSLSENTTTGTLAFQARPVNLGVLGGSIDVSGSNTLTIPGVIAGVGVGSVESAGAGLGASLTKLDTGALVISGSATYQGATIISNGTLQLATLQNTTASVGNLPATTAVTLGNASGTSGVLFLGDGTNSVNQTITGLTVAGGSASAVVAGGNGSTTFSTLTIENSTTDTYSGVIGGSGANQNNLNLIKSGGGKLVLSGANTYAGSTTLQGGIIEATNASSLGSGNLIFNGGVLGLDAGNFTETNGSGAGSYSFSSSINGPSYGGGGFAAYVADRIVNLGGSATPATVNWGNGSGFVTNLSPFILSASDATNAVYFENPINLYNGPRTIEVYRGSAPIDAILTGAITDPAYTNGLTKIGPGIIEFAGSSTYVGGTSVAAGTVIAGISNGGGTLNNVYGAFGPSADAISLGAGSITTGAQSASVLTGGSFTVLNPISVVAGSTGALSIGGNTDSNSSFGGLITVNNNLIISQVANAGSNALTISGGITGGASPETVTFAGPGNINVTTSPITDNAPGVGTLSVLVSGGLTTFATSNSYSGGTTFGGGTLNVGTLGALGSAGTLNFTGGVLQYSANNQTDYSARFNSAGGQAFKVDTDGQGIIFATPLVGAGSSLSTSDSAGGTGSLTIATTSTYTGPTTVNGGTLDVTGALPNSATITVNGTTVQAELVLNGPSAVSAAAGITVNGVNGNLLVNNSQSLASIASAGSATFTAGISTVGSGSGVGTGTGTTSLTTGGVSGNGHLTVNGTADLYASTITQNLLTIGSASTVTIADSAFPGNTAATSVLTDISDGGTLDLNNNDLIVLDTTEYSTVKALIASASDGGAWDQPGITSSSARANASVYGLGYAQASNIGSTSFDGHTFTDAVLVKYTLLGDTQLRGTVGIGDYDTVLSNYGTPQDWSGGDFHYGGVVGIGDYDDVLSNYGAHASGNLFVGPSLARSINAAASLSPDLAKTDLKLEVNTTTGDVYVLATASAAFTGYTISDPSGHLLGGSTSPDPDKLLSVAAQSGGNTNVYETSGTYVDWFKITETASQVAEGQQQNGFGTHSSRDDTINIPAGGTIDFGEIYNTAQQQQDLTFDFAEAGTEPTNGPTYYGAEVDYVTTPEPGTVSLLTIGAVGLLARRRRRAIGGRPG